MMDFTVVSINLRLLLVSVVFFLATSYHQSPAKISRHSAHAFLFQRLRPLPPAPTYSSFYYDNSTLASHPSSSYSDTNYHQPSYSTNRAQTDLLTSSARSFTTRESNPEAETRGNIDGCPAECRCDRVAQIADCSKRNLDRVPSGFPKDIKRIRLERNNITELGPNVFHGLKRLQRIDLSNNNLTRIDPLAFAGGLQSLNSLILYSNNLTQLPVNLFSELNQLQLLLLNANNLECINKELFQSLSNLNLLSLYDNKIETLANGTFEGLKNIKTIHLGKNPLVCDCNLRWLADFLESNPIETSEARCEGPKKNKGKKLSQVNKLRFTCAEGNHPEQNNKCAAPKLPALSNVSPDLSGCPTGCICNGSTVDCSRIPTGTSEQSRTGGAGGESGSPSGLELPDIPDDIPVYVTRVRINDNRIKRIRETGLFRRLATSQKLDLGNNRIVDIEDNAIGGAPKPERVIFVLLENEHCTSSGSQLSGKQQAQQPEDQCAAAPRVNPPNYDSPCYNGGSCMNGPLSAQQLANKQGNYAARVNANYSCLCPPGFTGPLCEINIDDCAEHQCQNGAMCVDGVNSYKCVCRDPTTSGEYCEQLNSYATSSANSIAPIALPMIASAATNTFGNSNSNNAITNELPSATSSIAHSSHKPTQQILARSADLAPVHVELSQPTCRRITQRKHYYDGNGCHSVRLLKLSECAGSCTSASSTSVTVGCCLPAKVKRRRVRMQCNDGASYVKTIDLIKKCACSSECSPLDDTLVANSQQQLANQYNATQEDHLLQITRLDAVD